LLKNSIAAQSRLLELTRFQRKAHALGRAIRLMNRKVTPPNSSIAPQMMIFVCFIHAQ
jgi:hypothetical protein